MSIGAYIFGAAIIGALTWFFWRPKQHSEVGESGLDELEIAEREVRDLGASTTPEEAEDELPDWGPGAPPNR